MVKYKLFSLSEDEKRKSYSYYIDGVVAALESPYHDNGLLDGVAYITYEFHPKIDIEQLNQILIEAREMYFAKKASSSLSAGKIPGGIALDDSIFALERRGPGMADYSSSPISAQSIPEFSGLTIGEILIIRNSSEAVKKSPIMPFSHFFSDET